MLEGNIGPGATFSIAELGGVSYVHRARGHGCKFVLWVKQESRHLRYTTLWFNIKKGEGDIVGQQKREDDVFNFWLAHGGDKMNVMPIYIRIRLQNHAAKHDVNVF